MLGQTIFIATGIVASIGITLLSGAFVWLIYKILTELLFFRKMKFRRILNGSNKHAYNRHAVNKFYRIFKNNKKNLKAQILAAKKENKNLILKNFFLKKMSLNKQRLYGLKAEADQRKEINSFSFRRKVSALNRESIAQIRATQIEKIRKENFF